MSRAIEKMRAGLAYKLKSLDTLQGLIRNQEADIAAAEAIEARVLAAGGTEHDANVAIMNRWPRRFKDSNSCKKFNLPMRPEHEFAMERAILQALLAQPLPLDELLRETGLEKQRNRVEKALVKMRAAGVVAMQLRPDYQPEWGIVR
jgi:hypothetical protein